MTLGTVVINERIFPINEVKLIEGHFAVVFDILPGVPWDPGNRMALIFGADGELVVQLGLSDSIAREKKPLDDWWIFTLTCSVDDKLGNRARMRLQQVKSPRRAWGFRRR